VLVILPHRAPAQAVAGSLQLGLTTNVVSHERLTTTSRYPAGDFDFETTSTQAGFGQKSTVGIEIGYGLDEHWVLGGLAALRGSSTSWDTGTRGNGGNNERRTFSLFLGPKFDYMLGSASSLRFFAGGAVGFVRLTDREDSKWLVPLSSGFGPYFSTDPDSSLAGFKLAGRVGLRWFATTWLSIDPAFFFDGSFLSGHGPHSASADAKAKGYTFGLSLAASGWMGL
jgi:hypothetical protein